MIAPEEIGDLDVGVYEKAVLYTIAALGRVPTARVLAAKCSCSVRRIRTAFKELREAGLLQPVPLQPAYVLCSLRAPRAHPMHECTKQIDAGGVHSVHPPARDDDIPTPPAVQPECTTCTTEPETAEIRHFSAKPAANEKPQDTAVSGEGKGGTIGGEGERATSSHTGFKPPLLPIEGRRGGVGGKQNPELALEPAVAPASRTPRTGSKRTFAEFLKDSGDGKQKLFDELARMFGNRGWELPDTEAIYERFSHHWLVEKRAEKSDWVRAFFNWAETDRDKWAFLTEEQRNARRRAGGRPAVIDKEEFKRQARNEIGFAMARFRPDGECARRLAEEMAKRAAMGEGEANGRGVGNIAGLFDGIEAEARAGARERTDRSAG